jgi:GNAT superfamily N-acetyltransferase
MLVGMSRRHMVIELDSSTDEAQPMAMAVRHPVADDLDDLAALMLDAYRGTIDADGSETLQDARSEVGGYFAAKSGEPMLEHSYLALDSDRLVGAILVSRFNDIPLLAYAMTAPSHKGRGVATGLTQRSLASLRGAGDRQMHLWVTEGNADAEHIYERLGFRDVPPADTESGTADSKSDH